MGFVSTMIEVQKRSTKADRPALVQSQSVTTISITEKIMAISIVPFEQRNQEE
jgi:hypothetical protein